MDSESLGIDFLFEVVYLKEQRSTSVSARFENDVRCREYVAASIRIREAPLLPTYPRVRWLFDLANVLRRDIQLAS